MRRLVPIVFALLAGCNQGSDQVAPPTTPPPETSPPASPSPTDAPIGCEDLTTGGAQFEITMTDYAFEPSCVVVAADQGPVLRNEGSFTHSFTVTGTGLDVDVEGGDVGRFEAIGLDAGTYDFHCKYHESLGMTGTLVVEG